MLLCLLPLVALADPAQAQTPGLVLSPSTVVFDEGTSAIYTVALATQPSDTVTVTIKVRRWSGSHVTPIGSLLSFDKTTLTFAPSTWNEPQTVKVSLAHDDDVSNHTASVEHKASGGGYDSVTAELTLLMRDDDLPGGGGVLTIAPLSSEVLEGEDARFVVTASPPPISDLQVNLNFDVTGDFFENPGRHTVKIQAGRSQAQGLLATVNDNVQEPDGSVTARINWSVSTGYKAVSPASATVVVKDDDGGVPTVPTLSISNGPAVVEGDTAKLTVTASPPPASDLTVNLFVVGRGDFFATSDLGAQTMTVGTGGSGTYAVATLNDNVDEENGFVHVTLGSGADYRVDRQNSQGSTDVTDDDTAGPEGLRVLWPRTGVSYVTVAEGGDSGYHLRLATQPSDTVTVSISGQAGTDLTLDETSLTFTPSNWNAWQKVTVSASQDPDAENDAATLVHTASGGGYGSVSASILVTVTDDETVGLVVASLISTSSLEVAEGGDVTYTICLATQPSGTVTVTIAGHVGTDLTLDQTSLTFTPSDWNIPQTVTVSAGEDADAVNDDETLTHAASGADYGTVTADLAVKVIDNDTAGTARIVLDPVSLTVAEGASNTYTVRLATQPSASVTVEITGTTGTDLSLDEASLTFNPTGANLWSTAQTVTVSAGGDEDASNDAAKLVHTASGGDYAGKTASLPVTTTDDEQLTVAISGVPGKINTTAGLTATFTFSEAVTGFVADDVNVSGGTKGDFSGSGNAYTLVVTPTGPANVVVTVTANSATLAGGNTGPASEVSATAVWDADAPTVAITGVPGTISTTALLTATFTFSEAVTGFVAEDVTVSGGTKGTFSGSGASYTLEVTPDGSVDVVVTVAADAASDGLNTGPASEVIATAAWQEPEIVLTPMSLTVAEGGSNTYTVKLASRPSAAVTVAITGTSGTDLTLDETTLTFNPTGSKLWSAAQTVTVSAGQDDDASNDAATLVHTASGGDYAGETASLSVTTTDDDTVGIVLTPASSLTVAEGGSNTYTVRLSSQPSAAVTVAITGTADTDLTLDETTLKFNPTGANLWSTARTVTVSAGEDSDASSDAAKLVHTASGGEYGGVTASLAVTTTDDDYPTVAIGGVPGKINSRAALSVTFTFSEAVTEFAAGDVTVSGGVKGTFSGSGASYTLEVTPDGSTNVVVEVEANSATVVGGNTGPASAVSATAVWDADAPTVAITGVSGTINTTAALTATFTWSEAVTEFVAGDVNVSGGTKGTFSGSGASYTLEVTPNGSADVVVTVTANSATDGLNTGPSSAVSATAAWEEPEIVLTPSSLTVAEGGSNTYTVKLASQPSASVTVAITGTSGTDLTPDATTLTFNPTGSDLWSTARTVTVSAGEDDDASNDAATLLHTATGGDYAGETASLSVTTTDDDHPTVAIGGVPGTINSRAALSVTFTFSEAVTGFAAGDVTVSGGVKGTFSGSGASYTLEVTPDGSVDVVVEVAANSATVGGGNTGPASAVSATAAWEEPEIVLTPSSLTVAEGGSNTYTVKLSSQPSASVTVAITGTTGTDLTLDETSLTFNPTGANLWSTARTVTVSADEDDDGANDTATLSHTATGGDYAGETASLSVTTHDDETAGIVLTLSSLTVAEGGSKTYTVKLASRPSAAVTVAITGTADTDLSLDETTLTFNPTGANLWSAAQTVTVSAGEDDDASNDTATLLHTASGGDYAGETASLSVTTTDDETAGIVLTPSDALTVAEGGSNTYMVKLASKPSAAVTVAITGTSGTDLTLAPSSATLTFNPTGSNLWSAAQTVTVSAGEDDDASNDAATLLHTASGGDYAGETASLAVTTTDDEAVGIVLTPATSLTVSEGGTNTYTVRLASQPSAAVTVAITGTSGTDLTLAPSSATLTFNPTGSNLWSAAQTVTVSAGEDDDASNDAATLVHTASGGGYAGETASLAVTTTDDETVGIVLTPATSLTVSEGGSNTYTVKLSSQPSGTVTVAITGTSGTDLTLAPSSTTLTFNPTGANLWSTARTVTVSAGQDDDAANDAATLVHTAFGGGYAGETASLSVTTTDDDTSPSRTVSLSVAPNPVDEGGSATVTARLSGTLPNGVTIPLTLTAGTAEPGDFGALAGIAIAAGSTAGTGTVATVKDADRDYETFTVALGALPSGVTPGSPSSVVVTIRDRTPAPNRPPTVTVSCAPCVVSPGGSAGLTATASDPEGDPLTYGWSATWGGFSGPVDAPAATWTAPESIGRATIRVEVSDGRGGTASASVVVDVVNAGPVFGQRTYRFRLPENVDGRSIPFELGAVAAEDADGDDLRYGIVFDSERFTVGLRDGVVRYVGPGEDYETEPNLFELTVRVRDDFGADDAATVFIEVTDENERPWVTAACDPCAVPRGGVVRLEATASDPDGDPLTYAWSAPRGRLSNAGEPVARWTAPDELGTTAIRVEVSDGRGGTASASVVVDVVNAGPVFGQRTYRFRLPENVDGRSIPFELGAVAAEDADGDDLRYGIVFDSERFTVGLRDGVVRYVGPGEDYETEPNLFELTVRVRDDFGADDAATVFIEVTDENERPWVTAACDPCAVPRGGVVRLEATASDPDGDPLTYAWSAPRGRLSNAGEPVARWTAPDELGTTAIRVEVSDGRGGTASAVVEVEVFNLAPEFGQRTYRFRLPENVDGRSIPFELGAVAAEDADGDDLRYGIVFGDSERFTVGLRDGVVRYVGPGEDYETEPNLFELTVRVRDDFGADDAAKVFIEVTDENERPWVTAACEPCAVLRGGVVRLEATASDPDGDPLTYAWSAPRGSLSDAGEPVARWTAPDELGTTAIRVEVSDGRGGTASAVVEVEVFNLAPAFGQPVYEFELPENVDGRENPAVLGAVAAEDPDGDALTYELVAGDRDRFAVGARDGVVTYIGPGEDYETEPNLFELTVRVRDDFGEDDDARVVVTVTDVNELPEVAASCDPCAVPRGGEVWLEARATDPDGDPLAYGWSAAKGRFEGPADQPVAVWKALDELGTVAIRVEVSDGRGGRASAAVEVEVVNRAPAFGQPLYLFLLPENVDGRESPADLGRVAALDPDGDALTYEIVSGDRRRFAVGALDGMVRYVGPGEDFETEPNRFELVVRAFDGFGGEARTEVEVEVTDVNEAPEAADDEVVTPEDQAVTVDVLANDTDPEGDRLHVRSITAAAHGTTRLVSGGIVMYTPERDFHGADAFTYVASDGRGLRDTATVAVTVLPVNDAPTAVGRVPDQTLDEGGGPVQVDLSPYFGDVDGDALTYGARSNDSGVVEAAVAGTLLTLTPVVYGSATVTVTAWDPAGLTATQSVRVGVSDRPQRTVLGNMLAATARGHLASLRAALGRRMAASPCEASRLAVMGRSVPLGRTEAADMLRGIGTGARSAAAAALRMGEEALDPFGAMRLQAGRGATATLGTNTVPETAERIEAALRAVPGRALGGGGGGSGAGAADFLFGWGGSEQDGGRCPARGRWSLWGQGDVQRFEGTPSTDSGYGGELSTAYVGLDTRMGARWLAGLAVSRSKGVGDWRAGTSDGRLTQFMTAVHPYLRWDGASTSVWASVGAGSGNAYNVRAAGRTGTSPTDLRLGLVELEQRLGAPGGLDFAFLGDAAWARLRTGDGDETIDRQDIAVNQVRIGLDLSLPARIGGLQLTPSATVHARRDGGAGQTGDGVEVAGGLRAVLGFVRLDAQARALAHHTAEGYGESGAAVTLALGKHGSEEGFSLSVSPRWGGPARASGALLNGPFGRGLRSGGPDPEGWTLDARAGYGVSLPGGLRLDLHGSYGAARGGPSFGLSVWRPASTATKSEG